MTDLIENASTMDLAIQDMVQLETKLRGYHSIYRPLWQRRAQRNTAHTSLSGLLVP
jgi:hypothetical protein